MGSQKRLNQETHGPQSSLEKTVSINNKACTKLFLFVCLFVLGFIVPLENFPLIWRRHHYRWRLQIFLTYTRHSWPLSSEGSSACHTYCDTGHPFIMDNSLSSPRTRDTHTYCRAFSSGAVTTCFYDLGLSRLGFEHPTYRLRGQHS